MGMSGIYQIRNTINGRVYIGSAIDIDRREAEHFKTLRGGYHRNRFLQRAWNKYGEDAFCFEYLELIENSESLLDAEQRHLDIVFANPDLRPYNICLTAGSRLGITHTAETRALISRKKSGKPRCPIASYKCSVKMRGRKKSAESIARRTMSRTGFRHTEEARAKISANRKGRGLHDDAWRARMSSLQKGRRMPEGHGAKIREAQRSLTVEQVAEIVARRKAGETYVDIAKDYNTTKDTIRNWCLREGGQKYDRVMPETLRQEIFQRRLAGESLRDICKKCRVGKKTVLTVYQEGLASMKAPDISSERPVPEPLSSQPEQMSFL